MAPPKRIRIEAGHEYSPTGVGRIVVVLERDGSVVMTCVRVGQCVGEWRGRVTQQAPIMIDEALGRAGFPEVPDTGGALLPDEAPTTFTVRRGWWREQRASVTSKTARIPGYREAIAIFEAICFAVSGGQYGGVAKGLGWLVGRDDEDDDPPVRASGPPGPLVGDDVYLPSERYLSRGEDDFAGGLCRVVAVHLGTSEGVLSPFIEVAEQPGVDHSWAYLAPRQDELRARFGDARGHAAPDLRPEFNQSIADQIREEQVERRGVGWDVDEAERIIAECLYHEAPISWDETDSPECPLQAEWAGQAWQLRIGSFPDEPLYTLLIDGCEVARYDTLPNAWRVPDRVRK